MHCVCRRPRVRAVPLPTQSTVGRGQGDEALRAEINPAKPEIYTSKTKPTKGRRQTFSKSEVEEFVASRPVAQDVQEEASDRKEGRSAGRSKGLQVK